MENAKEIGQREAVAELRARAEADPSFRAELEANPQEVLTRELGITAADLEQQLGDQELSAVVGGFDPEAGSPPRPCGEPGCDFKSSYTDVLFVHRLLWHGKLF